MSLVRRQHRWQAALGGGAQPSAAAALLNGRSSGVAIVFDDDAYLESNAAYGSMTIKGGSPYEGLPSGKLTLSGLAPRITRSPDGLWGYGASNLLLNSALVAGAAGVNPTNWSRFESGMVIQYATSARNVLDNGAIFDCAAARGFLIQSVTPVSGWRYRVSFDIDEISGTVTWGNIVGSSSGEETTNSYNGETTNGSAAILAIAGSRVYWDFTATTANARQIRLGLGVAGSATGHTKISRVKLARYPSYDADRYLRSATGAAATAVPLHWDRHGNPLGIAVTRDFTQLALWSSDFTNAAWVKLNVTAAKTATGADGVANSASTLTATAANGTVLQAIVHASAERISYAVIKRRTGSGVISITQDNGLTWTDITSQIRGSEWSVVALPAATVVNPIVGFRISASGDAVDVAWFVHSNSNNLAFPVYSEGTTVAVAADAITLATSNFDLGSAHTIVERFSQLSPASFIAGALFALGNGTDKLEMASAASDTIRPRGRILQGGVVSFDQSSSQSDYVGDIAETTGLKADATGARVATNGELAVGGEDTSVTLPTGMTSLSIGQPTVWWHLGGCVKHFMYLPEKLSDDAMRAITVPSPVWAIVSDGDSITAQEWPAWMRGDLGSAFVSINVATGGETLVQMEANAATTVDPLLALFGGRGHLTCLGGTNDLSGAVSLPDLQDRWNTYFSHRRAAGWGAQSGRKLVAFTIPARTGLGAPTETVRTDFNAWLRLNYSTYATHVVDLAADARFQNPADATYYVDGVHFTTAGKEAIIELTIAQAGLG